MQPWSVLSISECQAEKLGTSAQMCPALAWIRILTNLDLCAGGGTLGEISAAAGAVASSIWAAEDWAAKKLALPLSWAHSDSSDVGHDSGLGGGSGSGSGGGSKHPGGSGGSIGGGGGSALRGGGTGSLLQQKPGKCIPVRVPADILCSWCSRGALLLLLPARGTKAQG